MLSDLVDTSASSVKNPPKALAVLMEIADVMKDIEPNGITKSAVLMSHVKELMSALTVENAAKEVYFLNCFNSC